MCPSVPHLGYATGSEHVHNEFPELDSVCVGLNLWINNILQFVLNVLE